MIDAAIHPATSATKQDLPPVAPQPNAVLTELIERYRPRLAGMSILLGYLLVAFMLMRGWQQREQPLLVAESGLGYTLGILGGTLMLLLLLYPLRKRIRALNRLGAVKHWFRAHMFLGVVGPVCILFHCSFQLGSLNSNVALWCMLLVASSGLVGRYFYGRTHHGLYGQRATLEDLRADSAALQHNLENRFSALPGLLARLTTFETLALQPPASLWHSAQRYLTLGLRTWWTYLQYRRYIHRHWAQLDNVNAGDKKRLLRLSGARLSSIRKLAEFHFYERLFALWHVLHLPLFVMMVISGIVHVIAVHMY